MKTRFQVVTTQIFYTCSDNFETEKEAYKELKRLMEKHKFKSNYSFHIEKVYYENCEPDEFDQLLGPNPKKNAE